LQCRRERKRCVSYKVAIRRSWGCVKKRNQEMVYTKGVLQKKKKKKMPKRRRMEACMPLLPI
jgi:hypothetical protein